MVTRQLIRLPVTDFYVIFLVRNMVDCRSRINPRLTIFTDKNGYLVDEPQDGAYVPSDNSTDLGANQVRGLEQHKDGHLHIYSPALRYAGLNTLISFVTEGLIKSMVQDFVS